MNFSFKDILLPGRQRCRQWYPLISQQLRLRHIDQIIALNLTVKDSEKGSLYFTLHLSAMSSPFYTSGKVQGPNPKWSEIECTELSSVSAFVLRIWQQNLNNTDNIILTWGINLSGAVYLGSKISEILPSYFNLNTVIFYMNGGYFTSLHCIKFSKSDPLLANLNVVDCADEKRTCRHTAVKFPKSDVKKSCSVGKLRRLHELEVSIKKGSSDVDVIQQKINAICGPDLGADEVPEETLAPSEASNVRYAPQLLTMTSLNKMLQQKPTKVQKQQMQRINKEIEVAKFRNRILQQERDKKYVHLRQLKKRLLSLTDENEEKESNLMENYHTLSKEKERIKEFHRTAAQHRELLIHLNSQSQHRKKQLLQELLYIYPIQQVAEKKYSVHGVYLPNSDIISDCNDVGISVALGYVAHIVNMCSVFLQVPLRYPVLHYGSRSCITDQISASLPDRERDFPLFTKGKDKMQFTYAVYLLNKNIAQLRWLFYMNTPDLKLTLPNLLNFLQGYKEYKQDHFMLLPSVTDDYKTRHREATDEIKSNCSSTNAVVNSQKFISLNCFGSNSNISDPILDCLRHEKQTERASSPTNKPQRKNNKKVDNKNAKDNEDLCEILTIPEAFLTKQISTDSFKNYSHLQQFKAGDTEVKASDQSNLEYPRANNEKGCDINGSKENLLVQSDSIEEGTDLLDPKVNICDLKIKGIEITPHNNLLKENLRISRSVGSYTDDEYDVNITACCEMGSEPLLNTTEKANPQTLVRKWLDEEAAFIYTENLYPDELLQTSSQPSPLTARANALMAQKTFNMVKPKH